MSDNVVDFIYSYCWTDSKKDHHGMSPCHLSLPFYQFSETWGCDYLWCGGVTKASKMLWDHSKYRMFLGH